MAETVESLSEVMPSAISADEIALYDRQIRLWGMQAQEKIRNANILLITVKALGNEIAKNLVLAGIGSLTIIDDNFVTEDDLCAQFFISEADIGTPRAQAASPQIQKLNPRVRVIVAPSALMTTEPTFFTRFDMTIATDLPIVTLTTINAAARLSNRPFYAAGSHGMYGFVFADLISHTFSISRARSNAPVTPGTAETATRTIVDVAYSRDKSNGNVEVELVTKREAYQPLILANSAPLAAEYLSSKRRLKGVTPLLPCLRALWEFEKTAGHAPRRAEDVDLKIFTQLATERSRDLQLPMETLRSDFLRSFLQNVYAELAPVAAVLGAQVAQDVINVLGMREQPIQNMLLFDGENSVAPVYALSPIVPTL